MAQRKSYDTKIKYLARQGLLPVAYSQQIHRSLISKWKQEPVEKYVGYELNENIEELYEIMKLVSENQQVQQALRAMYRINKTLRDIIAQTGNYIEALKENKRYVINTVLRSAKAITLKRAIKLMNISPSTFRIWAMEEHFSCRQSLTKLCNNSYPQQLTIKEIRKMYRLLNNGKLLHWPIISVAHWGRKRAIIKVHPNTWYKYARLMKIKRIHYRKKRIKYEEGIRAKSPNQKWHADISEIQLGNGLTYYIYLVVDNYSRYILSWRISHRKCLQTRIETFSEALRKAKRVPRKRKTHELIVDQGTENNNKTVEAFIKNEMPALRKLVALKDFDKSNSMVEAMFRTLKYQYLSPRTYTIPPSFTKP